MKTWWYSLLTLFLFIVRNYRRNIRDEVETASGKVCFGFFVVSVVCLRLMLISRCRCIRDESVPVSSSRDGMDRVIFKPLSAGVFLCTFFTFCCLEGGGRNPSHVGKSRDLSFGFLEVKMKSSQISHILLEIASYVHHLEKIQRQWFKAHAASSHHRCVCVLQLWMLLEMIYDPQLIKWHASNQSWFSPRQYHYL